MGLGEFFKRRRARESAIPPGTLDPPAPARSPAAATSPAVADQELADEVRDPLRGQVALPGADVGELGQMIAEAIQSGTAQVSGQSHVVDMRGSGLREEILALLGTHGVEVGEGAGQIDAGATPGLQQDILEALGRHGLDPDDPGGGPPRNDDR